MRLLVLAASFLITTGSIAEPLKMHIPGSSNGIMFRLATIVKDGLDARGWSVDLRALGNCLLAKNMIETSTEPLITYWGNDQNIDKADRCYLPPPVADHMVQTFAASPYYLCVREDSPLTAQDIISGKKELSFTVTPDPSNKLTVELLSRYTKTKHKAITYKNSTDAVNAFIAGEVDVYNGTAGKEIIRNNKAKCYYNTSKAELDGTVPLGKALKADINLELVLYYIAKNLSPEKMNKLRADLKEITKTQEWIAATTRYKIPNFDSIEEQIKYIKESIANHG